MQILKMRRGYVSDQIIELDSELEQFTTNKLSVNDQVKFPS